VYLVDGNNVMGQCVGWHRDKVAAKKRLLRELAVLHRSGNKEVTVVFDGGPFDDVSDGELLDGVSVYFARHGSDADHRMLELVRNAPEPSRIIAVTSDRLLDDQLRELGAQTVRSGRFRKSLEEET
jgi:predicted RNA-binding protein with PIN domain